MGPTITPEEVEGGTAHDRREAAALAVCEENLRWYQTHGRLALYLYRGSQAATVILSAGSAVLVLASDFPKWVTALPAAIAAMSAGLNGIFLWREDMVRWLATAQALRTELANYRTRHPDRYGTRLSANVALDHFVERVQFLVDQETRQWQNLAMQRTSPVRAR